KTILQNKERKFSFGQINSYKTWSGQEITFEASAGIDQVKSYAIKSTGDPHIDRFLVHSAFPAGMLFPAGDVITSEGFETIRIANSFTKESILLDFSDKLNPRRTAQ